jgi:hypothetical protein
MDQESRISCVKAYRLGFRIAKAVWHHGENVQRLAFIEQTRALASELSLPYADLGAALAELKPATDTKTLMANARIGVEIRNGMDNLILGQFGPAASAAFRVGFGIISIGPQFDFLSMGPDARRQIQELCGSIASQLESLMEGAASIGISEKSVGMLKKIDADTRKADAPKMLLMMAGSAFDRELNGN